MATPRIPTRGTRFIDPEAERIRGRSALEALRGYAGTPSQSSAMYPGSQEAYESGELAGMAEMAIPGSGIAKSSLLGLIGALKRLRHGGTYVPGRVIKDVLYAAEDPAFASSYVEPNRMPGSRLVEFDAYLRKAADRELIEQRAKELGIENEYYTPASVFDRNLHDEYAIKKLIKSLTDDEYDHAILDDIPMGASGEGIKDTRATVLFPNVMTSAPKSGYADGGSVAPHIPKRNARFIDSDAEADRGRAAFEMLRGYAGAPSQASVMHPGTQRGYEAGELAGMAEMLIPGASMAKGALGAALAGVIKPRGGNWLESGLLPVLQDLKRATYNRPEPLENENLVELFRQNEALNRWVEGPLTKYLKRDIGTEQDPVRRLFDEGVYHVPPESLMDYRDMADADLALKRQMLNQPREPLSSGEGRYWENLVDEMIVGGPASEYMTDVSPAWMQKDPAATVYHFGPSTWNRTYPESALGLNHITDELDNSLMGEAGGLPRKFWLTPEKMEQMGMEKAVRHVDAINKWRAEQKIAANLELANKAMAVREYPDTPELPNPKGLRWVELGGTPLPQDRITAVETDAGWRVRDKFQTPRFKEDPLGYPTREEALAAHAARRDFSDLEKQLKYEGDVMGHCVGGYCPDVLEGKSRIFSLRDAKGEPHVTVEVNPAEEWVRRPGAIDENPIIKNEWPEFYRDLVRRVNGNPSPEDIATFKDYMLSKYPDDQSVASFFGPAFKIQQIKGKANKRPKKEYLPFVQDFVRNPPSGGQWSDIGDLGNTGLARFTGNSELAHMGGRFTVPPGLHSAADLRRMAKEAGVADDEIESLVSRYRFADGGVVRAPTNNWRRMELGGTIGYLMEG